MLNNIIIFWLVLQLFNLIGLPLVFKLCKNLPDRGYPFAKALGLLLVGYILWLTASFGLLRNNLGGIGLSILLVAGGGLAWQNATGRTSLLTWLKENRSYIITVELLFTLAFVTWAIFKMYTPNIETAGGEKWMEIAFINGSLLSPTFPPQDPWLADFGISYYYFGYILMAILTRLSGIVSTTAFNLFIPTLFSLTLSGAFSIVVNLVVTHQQRYTPNPRLVKPAVLATGVLGAFFVGIMGHWEALLEVFHSRGLLPAGFWQWLDIRDLKNPPLEAGSWIPQRFLWWWRGSRVLTDYNLSGAEQEVIDEFPFFSFMLGDVHPHVLALPFVLLAIALALNLLLNQRRDKRTLQDEQDEVQTITIVRTETETTMSNTHNSRFSPTRAFDNLVEATGNRVAFFIYAICLGALGFLNTWDLPIYLGIFGVTYLVWRNLSRFWEAIFALGIFGVVAIGLYFPFYISFQSQAGGVLPNLWNPTRLPQFMAFFGTFFIAIIAYLIALSRKSLTLWWQALRWTIPFTLIGPILLLILLAASFMILPPGREFIDGILADGNVQAALNGATINDLLQEVISRRLGNPWTILFLGGLAGWGLAHLWAVSTRSAPPNQEKDWLGLAERFNLILILIGIALPLSVEFIFLRDLFNTRMNTIFKFYFQAWVLLALSAAFGVYYVQQALQGLGRVIWQGVLVLFIAVGLIYPILASFNKTNNFQSEPTMDGIAWVAAHHPDDYAAIQWLRQNALPDATILERPGDSYNYHSRVSALTGRPTLIGWTFHEAQWRGSYEITATRQPDIEQIYNGLDRETTLTLVDKYDISYIYVGPLERQLYNPQGLAKFDQLFDIAFSQGDVVIYKP